MTSANTFKRLGICALFVAGSVHLVSETRAQSSLENGAAASEDDRETASTVDRGKMRLKLLINLVENELEEVTLKQSRLTTEAASLDQQRRALLDGPSTGTLAEKRQLAVIEERLEQIDQEMAEVNARLPEVRAELANLGVRLDDANGVVREPEASIASDGVTTDGSSQWLDSKRQVQEALVYLGGYNALIDGDFGPRTREAVRVYQGRQNVAQSGTLSDEQEAALLDEADTLRARYGMRTIEDLEAGYRVTYPSGLLPGDPVIEQDERRYTSPDGKGELVLTSVGDEGEISVSDLSAIYEQLLADYEVQYRRKRDDWFVVAGLAEEGRIVYDTARLSGGRLIRARLSYPSEWRDLWSPFAVIMFNTFEAVSPGAS